MKVLMQIRQNVFTLRGGDTIQMLKTKTALEELGVQVDLSLELTPDLTGYDLVHLFNLTRVQETYIHAENAKKQRKPIALSTIYWPNQEFEAAAGIGVRGWLGKVLSIDRMESLKAAGKFALRHERDRGTRYLMTHSYRGMQRQILQSADVFLPNSQEEMKKIEEYLDFCAPQGSVVPVPNAIDREAALRAAEKQDGSYEKYRGWIVCVGRIDSRKNQLNLIRALRDTPYRLLLIGKKSPGQAKYFDQVMREIAENPHIEYLEGLPNEELYEVYRQCKVSVLPSWFETPGLVSLEAGAMGCNLVVSPKGTTRDYFGDFAFYCDVASPADIREKIEAAYKAPFPTALKERILNDYTWEKAAAATLRGYQQALEPLKERMG